VAATGSREYGDCQTPAHLQRDSSPPPPYAADSARPHTSHDAVPPPTGTSSGGGGGGIRPTTLSAEAESATTPHGQSYVGIVVAIVISLVA